MVEYDSWVSPKTYDYYHSPYYYFHGYPYYGYPYYGYPYGSYPHYYHYSPPKPSNPPRPKPGTHYGPRH